MAVSPQHGEDGFHTEPNKDTNRSQDAVQAGYSEFVHG